MRRFEDVWRDTPIPSEEDIAIADARAEEERAVVAELQARSEKIATLRAEAPVKAKQLLAERVPELSPEELAVLPDFARIERIEQKISALTALVAEYGATKEGTNEPLNNDNRYLVEALAEMLDNETANRELIDDFSAISQRVDEEDLRRTIQEIMQRNEAA